MRVIDERLGRAKEGHFYERKVLLHNFLRGHKSRGNNYNGQQDKTVGLVKLP